MLYKLAALLAIALALPRVWDRLCGNHAIRIYARVLDENGQPIAGARQEVQVLSSPLVPLPVFMGRAERVRRFTVTTDASGCFVVEGVSGYGVSLLGLTKGGVTLYDVGGPTYASTWDADDSKSWAALPDTRKKMLVMRVSTVPPWRRP